MYIIMLAADIANDGRFRLPPTAFVYLSFLIFFDFVCIFYFYLKIDLIHCGLDNRAVSLLGARAQRGVCGVRLGCALRSTAHMPVRAWGWMC